MAQLVTQLPPEVEFARFMAVDFRVRTIIKFEPYPEALKPAIKLRVDSGWQMEH